MKRTLVSFVSEQTVPTYLFLKTMYQIGDTVLLIASTSMQKPMADLCNTLEWKIAEIKTHVLNALGDEDDWQKLSIQLSKLFTTDVHYVVNINGGTKLMNLALFSVLADSKYSKEYNYKPLVVDELRHIGSAQSAVPITHRLMVNEYCRLYGHRLLGDSICLKGKESAEKLFLAFTSDSDPRIRFSDVFLNLRKLRGSRGDIDKADEAMRKLYNTMRDKKQVSVADIPSCQELLDACGFETQKDGIITKAEMEYITGGWFEEWTYYQIKEHLKLSDEEILLNTHMDDKNGSEIDVAFMYNNSLHIIECKSGIERLRELKDYLYKADSIRAIFKAISAQSTIWGLATDNVEWMKAAQYVGIGYVPREQLVTPETRFDFLKGKK